MEVVLSLVELNEAKLYNSSSLFLSLITILLSSLLAIWLRIKIVRQKKVLNLPPSPPKLPIIGNIHQLIGELPHRSLLDLSNKYGPLLLVQLGHNPALVVSSAELVRQLVKSHDVVFSNRPKTTAANMLLYGCKDIVFAPYGEDWRQARKTSVLGLFSLRRVNLFQFVRDEEVQVLVNRIHRASLKQEPINLSEMLMAVLNNILGRCVVSRRAEDDEFGQLARRLTVLMGRFCIGDLFPYLRWLDLLTGFISTLKAASQEADAFLDHIIEEHGVALKEEITNFKKDFISNILQLQKDGKLEMELTLHNIKAILLDMFVAGNDTSSTIMEWLMAELIRHPNVMKKVQEEVRNAVGINKSKVHADDINKMEYLKCVIKETLRLHPPVALIVPRQTSASVTLGGYDIPSNISVFINAFAIQRDPNWWEKSEEFIPERFENSTVDFKGQDFQFIPFGCGRRICPGMLFGVASIEYVIANLLYFFDWKLSATQIANNLDMTELYGLTVNKKVPLHVVPISRIHI